MSQHKKIFSEQTIFTVKSYLWSDDAMTNINCSENCTYSSNGKCTFDHVTTSYIMINFSCSCAYFSPKESTKKTPQKS